VHLPKPQVRCGPPGWLAGWLASWLAGWRVARLLGGCPLFPSPLPLPCSPLLLLVMVPSLSAMLAQEVAMWEAFCSLVEGIKAGGQPSPHWPRIMELTQRVLFAVLQSAREGCREVQLSL
jgi:hypothetical protein